MNSNNHEPRLNDNDDELGDVAGAARMQKRLFWTLGMMLLLIGSGIAIYYRPAEEKKDKVVHQPEAPLKPVESLIEVPKVRFSDVTRAAGINFRHSSGGDGRKLLPETMGAGAAFLDYDNDGDPDLFLVNSKSWSPDDVSSRQVLYRNRGDGTFEDVSKETGVDLALYGQGVACGDYDDDGWVDLYITAVGENRLLRNRQGQSFEDVTEKAGVSGGIEWSTSAAFLDFDRDGRLDLFVANYIRWSIEIDLSQGFQLEGLGRAFGPPTGFQGAFPRLFRNLGDGRFEDVSATSGVQRKNPATGVPMGKSLGVSVSDMDGDGWPDILVANDTVQNFAFRNRRDGTFEDVAPAVALAFDERGNARGAMGIDSGDVRNNGGLAVVVGNFANEMDAFFISDDLANPLFIDLAAVLGVGAATRQSLTFGVLLEDFDLDGHLDYITANGHVEPDISRVQKSQLHAQSMELFWNSGGRAARDFVQLTAADLGEDFFKPLVGRGLLSADVEGDGDLDFLVTANNGPPRLLRNEHPTPRSLRLDLRTGSSKRPAFGAAVVVRTEGAVQRRYLSGSRSYLSQSEPILTFGLNDAERVEEVEITWPNGARQVLRDLPFGKRSVVQE